MRAPTAAARPFARSLHEDRRPIGAQRAVKGIQPQAGRRPQAAEHVGEQLCPRLARQALGSAGAAAPARPGNAPEAALIVPGPPSRRLAWLLVRTTPGRPRDRHGFLVQCCARLGQRPRADAGAADRDRGGEGVDHQIRAVGHRHEVRSRARLPRSVWLSAPRSFARELAPLPSPPSRLGSGPNAPLLLVARDLVSDSQRGKCPEAHHDRRDAVPGHRRRGN